MNVVCIYDGKSSFGGDVLSFLYLGNTANKKLGDRFKYTVVIPKGDGIQDSSTCNTCKLQNDTCYVNFYMKKQYKGWRKKYLEGKISFYDVYKKEDYLALKRIVRGYYLRFCVSGDPLALPYDTNMKLVDIFGGLKNTIMYSHFAYLDPRYKNIAYQSCESLQDGLTARIGEVERKKNEVICPAITRQVSCSTCMICRVRKKSVVFLPHGVKQNKLKKELAL